MGRERVEGNSGGDEVVALVRRRRIQAIVLIVTEALVEILLACFTP